MTFCCIDMFVNCLCSYELHSIHRHVHILLKNSKDTVKLTKASTVQCSQLWSERIDRPVSFGLKGSYTSGWQQYDFIFML